MAYRTVVCRIWGSRGRGLHGPTIGWSLTLSDADWIAFAAPGHGGSMLHRLK